MVITKLRVPTIFKQLPYFEEIRRLQILDYYIVLSRCTYLATNKKSTKPKKQKGLKLQKILLSETKPRNPAIQYFCVQKSHKWSQPGAKIMHSILSHYIYLR